MWCGLSALAGAMQRLSCLEHHHRSAWCGGFAEVARNERLSGYAGNAGVSKVQNFQTSAEALPRFSTGFKEFDRVLGGGVVPGSAILIGGNPARVNRRCCCKRCASSPNR
jgi:DNA repair protein RadA/Sms